MLHCMGLFIFGILGMLVGLTLITFYRIKYDNRNI